MSEGAGVALGTGGVVVEIAVLAWHHGYTHFHHYSEIISFLSLCDAGRPELSMALVLCNGYAALRVLQANSTFKDRLRNIQHIVFTQSTVNK